ncbi:hypothetical protein BJ322DRAFT_1025501 [Thelephora terrestris]|uniref:Ribonuclease H1 N-terminal domain-containing protein n=1 Tax=Thelephora terrestris TaxID=56493 RepID=A0A9P6L1E9_9AGAM|nr:hypothetical protein BJ322DRAFT_1025566 [Thelephora terrestris]KAF9777934.1 hypothetical protein BJ322DRAFT_1025501 [Thelephora terrestris]
MPRQRNARRSIELSPTSAFDMCDGLLRMSFHLMIQLPEAELRDIRYVIDTLLTRADRLLDTAGPELSLNFTALAIDPEPIQQPWTEDFGAILVSTSTSVSSTSDVTPSTLSTSTFGRCSSNRVPVPNANATAPPVATPVPTPTRAPTPTPDDTQAPIMHGRYPLIISSRRFVGRPDYTHHPEFVRPGVPGPYRVPPTASGLADYSEYYVVSKGLYVGIFLAWQEIAPWVTGVSHSNHRKFDSWDRAKYAYNSRLAAGTIEVLN